MATLTLIPDVESFFPGERPSHEKFTEGFSAPVNTIITNHITVNDAIELLLQGVGGGAEQAKIPFAIAAAPNGWTRDVSFTTDHLLRVTDGSTLPPGANPIVTGGSQGGDWTITGSTMVSQSDHTHTMNAHTHSMGHSHAGGSHTHPISSHTHVEPSHAHTSRLEGTTSTSGSASTTTENKGSVTPTTITQAHTHDIFSHTHGTGSSDAGTNSGESGGSSGADVSLSDPPSPSTTDGNSSVSSPAGTHNHTISHVGNFRPKYLNILICSKD